MIVDTNSLPRYRSHKTVWAQEIGEGIVVESDGSALLPIAGADPVRVEAKVIHRYFPMPGDFLVYYADGYHSISPRKAFLQGYTRDDGQSDAGGMDAESRRYQTLTLAVDISRSRPDVNIIDLAKQFESYVKG